MSKTWIRMVSLLGVVALLLVGALFSVNAQEGTPQATEGATVEATTEGTAAATLEAPATDETMPTDEMMATDDMTATDEMMQTDEMMATDEMAATDEMMATDDMTATDEAEVIGATGEVAPEDLRSFVRFAHFAPEAPAVDVYVNGEVVNEEAVEFGNVSMWMALSPDAGALDVAVAPSGGAVEEAVLSAPGVQLGPGWHTVAVVASPDGTLVPLIIQEAILPFDTVLPGTSTYTFVSALGDGRLVNFNRDDIPYMTELGSDGQTISFGTITEDAGTHTFSASLTENDEVLAETEAVEIVETSTYLIVLLGGEQPQLIVHETPRAQLEIAQGNLEAPGTIIEAAAGNELLQPFGELVETAGLTETLSGEGPFTVFAPANFIADDIQAGEELEGILLNHVVEGDLKTLDLTEGGTFTTVGGQELTVEVQGNTITVNGIDVIAVNIPATNGTIHVINGVITPPEAE